MSSAGIEPVGELLVIRFGSLGDLVLTFPALALLRQRSPGARIVLLTKEAYAPLAAALESVDEVIPVPPSASGALSSLRLALELRRRRFAAVYDLHSSLRSHLVAALSGSPLRLRVDKRALERRRLVAGARWRRVARRPPPPPAASPAPLAALAAAHAIDPRVAASELPRPTLGLGAAAAAELEAARGGSGQRPLSIALCPGARHPTKCWPGFPALASALTARGDRVVVVLGPDDLWEGPDTARVVRGPLLELARVLAGCDLAVGNDSGLTHVAAAAGTPAVVLFGPTTPALGFLPVGAHRVVERHDLNCRPCDVHGGRRCPRRDQACLAGIPPARVMAEVDDLAAELAGQEMVHVR